MHYQLWIASPRKSIRSIKEHLEKSGTYDSSRKIIPVTSLLAKDFIPLARYDTVTLENDLSSLIPTIHHIHSDSLAQFALDYSNGSPFENWSDITDLSRQYTNPKIELWVSPTYSERIDPAIGSSKHSISSPSLLHKNPISATISYWLDDLPNSSYTLPASIEDLIAAESWSFQIYPPLLLLGPKTFKSKLWTYLLSTLPSKDDNLETLYQSLCKSTNCTHIAINAAIPLHTSTPDSQTESMALLTTTPRTTTTATHLPNTLRKPTSLLPLYAPSHHPFPPPTLPPTKSNFTTALWAQATQNSIQQIFSPMHTMFSRGNIKEKARVLEFPLLGTQSDSDSEEMSKQPKGVTAVDLYAGIGYFAFSYAKAGADVVLGWEINGWSVEGFRRGVRANAWHGVVVRCTRSTNGDGIDSNDNDAGAESEKGNDEVDVDELEHWLANPFAQSTPSSEATQKQTQRKNPPKLAIFHESNAHAARRIAALRHANLIPAVRHVNCGYLPSSDSSWSAALQCLDPVLGGWIHAHENVGVRDVDDRRGQIERVFAELCLRLLDTPGQTKAGWKAACTHVERVKSFAPGVVHCVFDVLIS
jgi:tRNA wybutosine-synthesizing protein 2